MEIAAASLFRAKWTDEIHDEWTRNLLLNRPDLSAKQLARTRALMDASVMDCLVDGYQSLIPAITLPDPDDRHVLAAAIIAGADGIITFNLKDFPASELSPFGIEAQHPDDFLWHQFGLDPAAVVIAAQRCRARLKKNPKTAKEYLDRLEMQSLTKTVSELRAFEGLI